MGFLQFVVPGDHTVWSFRSDGTFSLNIRVFGGQQPSSDWELEASGSYTFTDKNHIELQDWELGTTIADVIRLSQKELRLRLEGETIALTRIEETSPDLDRTPATRPDEDKPHDQATVTVEASEVFSQASASSKIVKTLKKGDVVLVDFEILGAGGAWCSVKEVGAAKSLGYVLCKDLERQKAPPEQVLGAALPPPSAGAGLGSARRIRVGGKEQGAKLISWQKPELPPLAKQARIQGIDISGTVRLEAIVNKDGTIQDLELLSGHPLLVKAAIEEIGRAHV